MINKILATKLNSCVPQCSKNMVNRKYLKPIAGTMAILAGASMSNHGGPRLEPTEMIIPDGLSFQEKLYYNLRGKLPQSVYDRWIPKTESVAIGENDEIVTINTDGRYIGSIVEAPHDALLGGDVSETFSHGEGVDTLTGGEDISSLVSPDTESAISTFEIFKHLAGLQ